MLNMQNEIWRDVVDFEGYYQVSNLGRVRWNPNRPRYHKTSKPELKKFLNKNYHSVDLSINNKTYRKSVHQLVAAAFIHGFKYGETVNHIDGDKTNNMVDNLEKTTNSLNNIHAYQTGLKKITNKKSQYFGVSTLDRKVKRKDGSINIIRTYKAQVRINGEKVYIKQSTDELECAKAYDDYLNQIGDTIHQRNFP